jgi:hypothetical protein
MIFIGNIALRGSSMPAYGDFISAICYILVTAKGISQPSAEMLL